MEKLKQQDIFEEKLLVDQLRNLAEYFVSVPSEIAMTLWKVMGSYQETAGYNIAKLHGMTSQSGVKVQEFIVEMLTGK